MEYDVSYEISPHPSFPTRGNAGVYKMKTVNPVRELRYHTINVIKAINCGQS